MLLFIGLCLVCFFVIDPIMDAKPSAGAPASTDCPSCKRR